VRTAWTLEQVLLACKGELVEPVPEPGVLFGSVTTDTRNLGRGQLFVALRGERFDGHDFLEQALEKGAAGLLLDRDAGIDFSGLAHRVPVILVPGTLKALGDLAAYWRAGWEGRLIAVTGSNGKSSTKEFCWSILNTSGINTLKNKGNFNNLVGLPLTLLGLCDEHHAAVVELGTNAPGEIARLAEIARPDVAAVLNVGRAHLEGLGSLDGVAAEKGAIYEKLSENGVAVANLDDELASRGAFSSRAERRVTFGRTRGADVRILDPIEVSEVSTNFTLLVYGRKLKISLKTAGVHHAMNAAAATALALEAGARIDAVEQGLGDTQPLQGRFIIRRFSGIRVIDDTYNANPASVKASLHTLSLLKGDKKAVLVMGEMLELGTGAEALHREIGRTARELGIDLIVALPGAEEIVSAAVEAGVSKGSCLAARNPRDVATWLAERIQPGDFVLIKGSRGSRTERVIAAISEVLV